MPYIPHTPDEVNAMLEAIGVKRIEDLFDEIPESLRCSGLDNVPEAINEMNLQRFMTERSAEDGTPLCFAGGGAYEHYIPAAVWEVASRGEFYSAYTPYQAEASQGTLQLVYEFQSMIASITGMEAANASLYDGASALAEAVLMAVRVNKRKEGSKRVLMPETVHPTYFDVVKAIVSNQGITLDRLKMDQKTGNTPLDGLTEIDESFAALVIPQPNYLGTLEEVHALTDWAHGQGAQVIAVVNPVSLMLLEAPGKWGTSGADIVVGEGQPLGLPLSSGGPYYGFMACKMASVRQMPGRIVGQTVDLDGNRGFSLTLQAREQHIRRSKATSNICTNQGLMATASTIHMALMGEAGLRQVAEQCVTNTQNLMKKLKQIKGVSFPFTGHTFHEFVIELPRPAREIIEGMAGQGILAGIDIQDDFPALQNPMLVCVTETRSEADMDTYVQMLDSYLNG